MQRRKSIKRAFSFFLSGLLSFALVCSLAAVPGQYAEAAKKKKFVKSLLVSKTRVNLTVGSGGSTVNATVKTKGKVSKKVKVKSSNSSVVKVSVKNANSKGVSKITLAPKRAGSAVVSVTTAGKKKNKKKITKKIRVSVKARQTTGGMTNTTNNTTSGIPTVTSASVLQVTQVNVSVGQDTLVVGDTTTATAGVLPAGAVTSLLWTSSNQDVATVDAKGQIVACKEGTAKITATASNGVSGYVSIKVTGVPVTGVSLNRETADITVGGTTTLTATVAPKNATNRRVTWTSSDTGVATVDSEGKVTGVALGTANITVETEDGGLKATCVVTVVSDSKKDVDKIEATVTNSLEDYPNTVLTGTRAQIRVTVTKDGVPYGDETVALTMEGLSGYASYYKLEESTIELNSKGTGTAYVVLKDAYDTKDATIDDAENWSDAAFAGMKITINAGGANLTSDISLTFGQILIGNELSNGNEKTPALTVNNQYGSAGYDPIDSKGGGEDTHLTSVTVTNKSNKTVSYYEEYVVDQKVSSDAKSHAVELDAAPLLVLPSTEENTQTGNFEKTLSVTGNAEYSVYSGIENAYTIEDVPGGLEYLTLTFASIELSSHTKLVIGCYEADTNIPIAVKKIEAEAKPQKNVSVQLTNVFNKVKSANQIDVKIFVESAGQVDDSNNAGYTLTSVKGPYRGVGGSQSQILRLMDDVTWSVEERELSVSYDLKDAASYLGSDYNSNYTYTYQLPSYPQTGNAIIVEKGTNNDVKYYLYPTERDEENGGNKLAAADSDLAIEASSEEIQALTENYTTETNKNGNYVIDSKKVGVLNVVASIDTLNDTEYKVYSSVQWTTNSSNEDQTQDFYAVAGETVTLVATVKDKDGVNKLTGATVEWLSDNKSIDKSYIMNQDTYSKTDKDGQATLQLHTTEAFDLTKIKASLTDASKETAKVDTLTVGGQEVTGDCASIHWVQAGVSYQSDVDGEEWNTLGVSADVTTDPESYKPGSTWILGTKVVGKAYGSDYKITNISNIKIESGLTEDDNMDLEYTDKENGVITVTTENSGDSTVSFKLGGYENSEERCKITVATLKDGVTEAQSDEDYEYTVYTSVGEGSIQSGDYSLNIPVMWESSGANVDILLPSGNKFYTGNSYDGNKKMHVYLRVQDSYDNPVKETNVSYKITKITDGDATGTTIADTSGISDTNGLIDVSFATPTAASKYKIIASMQGSKSAVTRTLTFMSSVSSTSFTLEKSDEKSDGDAKKVVIRSNCAVDADILTKDMFILKDGTTSISIDSIAQGENDNTIVITTKDTFTSSLTVSYDAVVTDATKGVVSYLVNEDGVLYTGK